MKITLKVFDNSAEMVVKTLGEGVFRVGRSDFSDIILPSDKVSRSHVEIRINEAAAYFTNMSSPGQVKLNGRPKETGEIADGDELQVGPYRILMLFGDAAEVAQQAAAEMPMSEAVGAEGMGGGFGAPDEGADGGGFNASPELQSPDGFSVKLKEVSNHGSSASIGALDTDVEVKPVVAKLLFTEGAKKGEEIPLEAYEVTFGRSKKADIFVDDERLSRVHCKIARVGMGYRLFDLESRNGTFVNGMRVLEHPLSSFDEIQIGGTKIKFLIHDVMMGGGIDRAQNTSLVAADGSPIGQTESVALGAIDPRQLKELHDPRAGGAKILSFPTNYEPPEVIKRLGKLSRRNQILLGIVAGLLFVFLLLPNPPETGKGADVAGTDKLADVKIPPAMPKEYAELTEETQRTIEGHYNSALKAADAQDFEAAVAHLRAIHELLPFYRKSRDLMDRYGKKVKEKQVAEAQAKAQNDEKQDLAMYLQDGIEYLKEGDFQKAGEAFNSAIVIDPANVIAAKGLRAADSKIRDIEKLPPEVDPEMEKKKAVLELFQKAVTALQEKQYQEAINNAEQARRIELKGDTQYLNEAKQIIDQARIMQKDEFEPFLINAKELFAQGDFNETRNLCEEMLKKDPSYQEARDLLTKARKNLHRLAKEAYTHGYILESMNRIEEAKQYWNRAKNYVREGDDYFDKVNRKLDNYQ